MTQDKVNRRKFLASSTGMALAGWALSRDRAWGANERIGIGVVGCGGRGTYLMGEVQKNAEECNAEVVAVCDVWKPQVEKAVKKVEEMTGKKPYSCARFADLLARPEVDAVLIATPDHAHSPVLAAAARAKKHAYCEKPMASRLEDAIDATDAVHENGVIAQIGTQRRSEPRHMKAAGLVQSGILGTVSEIDTAWHRNVPSWARPYDDVRQEDVDWEQYLMGQTKRPFDPRRFRCWHLFRDYSTGLPGLLGSHITDLAVWYMDDPFPLNGVALGGIYVWKDGREHCDTIECLWEFPKGFLMRYSNRLGNSKQSAEVILYGTNGTFDTGSWKATGEGGAGEGKIKEEVFIPEEAGESHMHNFLRCVREGKQPNAPVDVGYAHSVSSILASKAQVQGVRLVYDAEKREIREG